MSKDPHAKKLERKKELERRKANQAESLAYNGLKYKTDELTPVWFQVESAIYQAYVISEYKLVDRDVKSAVESLIRQTRSGTTSTLDPNEMIRYTPGEEHDLVIACIRLNCAGSETAETRPSRDDFIGVLRSVLGTIELKRVPGPDSQYYLRYIAGFLKRSAGISSRMEKVNPADSEQPALPGSITSDSVDLED